MNRYAAAVAAVIAVYVAASALIYNQIDEDAYIYMRVADNLALGHGYVFNPGDARIETGSAPLWQMLLLLGAVLTVDLTAWAKLLGVAFGIGCILLLYRLSRETLAERVSWFVPPAMLALSVPFVAWMQRGLESPLHVFTVLWLTLWLVRPPRPGAWVLPAVVLLLGRPEAPLLLLLILAPYLLARWREWRSAVVPLAVLVGTFSAMMLIRYLYFDDLVVSAYYVKPTELFRGQLGPALLAGVVPHALLIPFFVFLFWPRLWTGPCRVVAVSCGAMMLWSMLTAELYKPFFRHVIPALPFLFILACAAVEGVARRWRLPRRIWLAAAYAVLVGFVALQRQVALNGRTFAPNPVHSNLGRFLDDPARFAASTAAKLHDPFAPTWSDDEATGGGIGTNYQALVGRFVKLNFPAGTTLLYDQMGQTPFFAGSDKRFIDTHGLTDRTVGWWRLCTTTGGATHGAMVRILAAARDVDAGRACQWETVASYLLASEPTAVLINRVAAPQAAHRLRIDPRFQARFEMRYAIGPPNLPELVVVFERRDSSTRQPVVPAGLRLWTDPTPFRAPASSSTSMSAGSVVPKPIGHLRMP
ncbi:MAG: hypothetical protein ACRD3G_07475 [Vicinamibacterales bacterium]